MKEPFVLSVCVLSYNGKEVLVRFLRSVYGQDCLFPFEVLVTDNGSTDGTADMVRVEFPDVRLYINKRNVRFTRAYNMMFKDVCGKYVLIVNNDVEFSEPLFFSRAIEFLDRCPDVGAVIPRSVKPDGTLDLVCKPELSFAALLHEWSLVGWLRPRKRLRLREAYKTTYNMNESQFVDVVQDSCVLLRCTVLKQVRMYDENFRLYYTEDDLSNRIRQAGWRLYYNADLRVSHISGYTTRRMNRMLLKWQYVQDMLAYSRKYFGFWRTELLLAPLTYLRIALQFPVWSFKRARS